MDGSLQRNMGNARWPMQRGSLDAVQQMAVAGAGVAVLPSLYALAEAMRDTEFAACGGIDHPIAFHDIALHWPNASPMGDDFKHLAARLIEARQEIRETCAEQSKGWACFDRCHSVLSKHMPRHETCLD